MLLQGVQNVVQKFTLLKAKIKSEVEHTIV